MRHVDLKRDVLLIGERVEKDFDKRINYYILVPGYERIFAFQKKYYASAYRLCKNGIRINDLSVLRTRDRRVMKLVDYVNVMLPYFTEYYELPVAV